MSSSLHPSPVGRHPVFPDMGRPVMAKADVQTPDVDWLQAIGRAISHAVSAVGWSHKEAASHIAVDDAEFGKWLSGHRRPQLDKLFAVPELRQPLVLAMAELADGVVIETVVRVTRTTR